MWCQVFFTIAVPLCGGFFLVDPQVRCGGRLQHEDCRQFRHYRHWRFLAKGKNVDEINGGTGRANHDLHKEDPERCRTRLPLHRDSAETEAEACCLSFECRMLCGGGGRKA